MTVDATTSAAAASLNVAINSKLVIKGASATTLTITGGASNAGTIEIGVGSTFHAQATLAVGGTLSNTGLIHSLGFGNALDGDVSNTLGTINVEYPLSMNEIGATLINTGTITVGGQFDLNGQNLTMTGGSLVNDNLMTVHDSTVTHSGGTISIQPIHVRGGTLHLTSPDDVGLFKVNGAASTLADDIGAAETVIVEGGTTNLDGVLSSTEDRTNNGTVKLTSIDSTKTGRFTFSVGKSLTNSSTGTIESTVSSGGGGSPAREIAGNLINNGALNVGYGLDFDQASATLTQASGSTTLNANLDLTGSAGTFTVNGGTVNGISGLTGNLNNVGGTVAPGTSPGILTVTGNYTQNSGGTLAIQIGGTLAGTQNDRLAVTGTATLDGTLALTRVAFTPGLSFSYDFLTYASHTGVFSTVSGTTIGGGKTFQVNYNSTAGNLTVQGASITRQPDGLIAIGSGAFAGNDLYNTDASGQSQFKTIKPGHKATFTIQVANDGTGAKDKFKIHATGASVSGYVLKFMSGSTNITTAVKNGTFATGKIAAGHHITITCIVTMSSAAAHGSEVDELVILTSTHDAGQQDVVGLAVHRN